MTTLEEIVNNCQHMGIVYIPFEFCKSVTIEDIAIISENADKFELDDEFRYYFRYVVYNMRHNRFAGDTIYVHDDVADFENLENMCILFAIKEHKRRSGYDVEIITYHGISNISEDYLQKCWEFAENNGLAHLNFGDTIKRFGYVPKGNEAFSLENCFKPKAKSDRNV